MSNLFVLLVLAIIGREYWGVPLVEIYGVWPPLMAIAVATLFDVATVIRK